MKQLSLLVAMGMLLAVPATSAADQISDEIELTRSIIQTERQAIITVNMELTEEESRAFWPVFREYRQAMSRIGDRMVRLISDYAENYEELSDQQAEAMLAEYMDIEKAELSVKRRYVKQMRKVLPSKKLVRFFQLENKLDTIIDFELAAEIPLVR
jgi:uncharacterized protein YktB (UPF0637 family)